MTDDSARNVFGEAIVPCSEDPLTGFLRDGCCNTNAQDVGNHTICVQVTADFLAYSKAQGNDLSTPRPEFGFEGLKPGDRWCVCAGRWKDAFDAGYAAPIIMQATHERALEAVSFSELKQHAIDLS